MAEMFDNINNSDSIFEDDSTVVQGENAPKEAYIDTKYKDTIHDNFVLRIIDAISMKIGEIASKSKFERDIKNLQQFSEKKFAGKEEIVKLLYGFGCKLVILNDVVDISCERFNLKGKITFDKNKQAIFDENTMQIFRFIASIINNTNNLDETIDMYEKQGFFPVGNMEKKIIKIDGKDHEILVGTFQNQQGEKKTVYFNNGKEITPKKDTQKKD